MSDFLEKAFSESELFANVGLVLVIFSYLHFFELCCARFWDGLRRKSRDVVR